MKTFSVRTQATGGSVRSPKLSKWVTIVNDDITITIDGSQTHNSLSVTIDANGVRYMLTDVLLEIILGRVAEEYSDEFLNFNVYQYGGD